jgi:hypothetical protein
LEGRANVKLKISGYLSVAGCCLTLVLPFAAQDKNLALTPPTVWNRNALCGKSQKSEPKALPETRSAALCRSILVNAAIASWSTPVSALNKLNSEAEVLS